MVDDQTENSAENTGIEANRRKLLEIAGLGIASALGGCSGNNDQSPEPADTATQMGDQVTPTDQTGSGDSSGTPTEKDLPVVDELHALATTQPPSQLNTWNVFTTGVTPRRQQYWSEYPLYVTRSGDIHSGLAHPEDVNVMEDGISVKLRTDEYTWSTGDSLHARDLVVKHRLENWVNNTENPGSFPEADAVNSIEEVSDDEVKFTTDSAVNKDLFITNNLFFGLENILNVNRMQYGQWIDKFNDATTEEEINEVRGNLTGNKEGVQAWVLEEPAAIGPLKPGTIEEGRIEFTPNEHHPHSDKMNFPGFEERFIPENQAQWKAVGTGQVDSGKYAPPQSVINNWPDWVKENQQLGHFGVTTFWNHRREFGDRNIRKALAWALNRDLIMRIMGHRSRKLVEIPCGVTDLSNLDKWLGDAKENYTKYAPYSADREKATQILEDNTEYYKEDGTWMTPEGEPWTIDLKTTTWTRWLKYARSVVNQLQQFGINANLVTQDDQTYFSQTLANKDFDMAMEFYGGWNPHPYFYLTNTMNSSWWTDLSGWPNGELWEDGQPEEIAIEVPPVGKPDGNLKEFHVIELLNGVFTSTDSQVVQDNIQTLTWIWNQTLPGLQTAVGNDREFVNVGKWDVQPEDHWTWDVTQSPSVMMKQGLLQAKPKSEWPGELQ